ncbi:MAG TPA: VOC family protein [Myxococcota bacterium]|nr:VOC family protein [Myxococcota bacterium]
MRLTPSHFGLCVRDLDRSLRFWCDGLGFERAERFAVGDEFGAALEVEGRVDCVSQFIRKDGLAIELLAYRSPGAIGAASLRRNQVGFTHFSLYVDDLAGAVQRLVACGGKLLPATRTQNDALELLFVEDPDGVRVELMHNKSAS